MFPAAVLLLVNSLLDSCFKNYNTNNYFFSAACRNFVLLAASFEKFEIFLTERAAGVIMYKSTSE